MRSADDQRLREMFPGFTDQLRTVHGKGGKGR